MPRKKSLKKKIILPDSVYDSILIQMVINQIIKKGKKRLASKLINQTLNVIENKLNKNPLEIVEQGILNVTPVVEIKARRIGGAVYPIPIELTPDRGNAVAIRWILQSCNSKAGKDFASNLANEFIEASNKMGSAMRKKIEVHKIAESSARLI